MADLNKMKNLRKNMTEAEKKLWFYLKNRNIKGCKFRRQYGIGNYIVDFVCIEKMLVIEIDGGGHNVKHQIEYDENRTKVLSKYGYKVVRFWNNDVLENIEGVLEIIFLSLEGEVR